LEYLWVVNIFRDNGKIWGDYNIVNKSISLFFILIDLTLNFMPDIRFDIIKQY